MANDMKKQAMSETERQKYVKAAIAAAIGSAGIGALVRSLKAKSDRSKALDVDSSKNAIIVPIKKSKFVEDLLTPDEFAASKKEQKTPSQPKIEQAPSFASMDPSDIAARKKEILRGRKVDFFGKWAAVKDAQPEKKDGGDGQKKVEEVVSEEKIDGRVVLRGQDGKFVSPTDPVAVQQVEKDAGMGIWDTITHPGKALGKAWDAAKERPVIFTAGALGSIYLAAKISDAINEIRRKHAEQRLDGARDRYVKLLEEDNEKKAFDMDVPGTAGTVLGTAFIVPMALTALVTNKIIENRNAEKKKAKEMSDSYPDDPIVLYKTSEAKEVRISPETAIVDILLKKAMIMSAEMYKCAQEQQIGVGQKSAIRGLWDGVKDIATNPDNPTANGVKWTFASGKDSPYSVEEATNYLTTRLTDKNNSGHLLNFAKAYTGGSGEERFHAPMYGLLNSYGTKDESSRRFFKAISDPSVREQVMSNMSRSQSLNDALVDNIQNNEKWEEFNKGIIENGANGVEGLNATFKPGSFLHSLVSWFMNVFGIGKNKISQGVNDMFAKARREYESQYGSSNATRSDQAGANRHAAQTATVQNPAVVPSPVPQVNPPTGTATNNVVNVSAPA